MRKIPCLLISLLSAISILGQKKEIGVKLALTTDRFLSSGYSEGFSSTLFYSAGITGNLWVGKKLFISSGINYGNTGSRVVIRPFDNNQPGQWRYQLRQIILPLSLNFTMDRKNNFSLGAGVFGAILPGASKKFKTKGSNNWTQKTDISDDFKNFNYGLQLGAGYRVRLNKNKVLTLGIEERLGLKNILVQTQETRLFTQSFGLHADLLFSL